MKKKNHFQKLERNPKSVMYCVFDSPWHWCQDTQGYMDMTIGMLLLNFFCYKAGWHSLLIGRKKGSRLINRSLSSISLGEDT